MNEAGFILLKGLKTVWTANSGVGQSLNGISGPYRQEMPAGQAAYPYCVIESGDVDPIGWSCDSKFYRVRVSFIVYDKTVELCAAKLGLILDVFADEDLQITLETGSVISKRESSSDYQKKDVQVWSGSQEFVFEINIPR